MRYMRAVMATLAGLVLLSMFATPANAQAAPAEVTCNLVDETSPSKKNTDGSYNLGNTISLNTDYTDPDNRVQTFIFSEQLGSGTANNFEVGNAPFADWTPSSTGTWTVRVELRDEGNASLCSDSLVFTIVNAQEEPPPTTTTTTTAPPTTTTTAPSTTTTEPSTTSTTAAPTTSTTVTPATNPTPTTSGGSNVAAVSNTSQPELPRTGKMTGELSIIGGLLLLGGTLMVLATRRRKSNTSA